ncbi:MAG: hypothetical protein H9777_08535 [Candidatus Phocaeicola faecigallinarum]|uniref:Uncharacterized protein n=1 Tax=Candidatus Phocaeicola faecigallinarum TaxID=2838732 RepID=A0A948TC98_9BACT|nr:hypothetical protein [Candidatus Phocaeicola faecigallinarum]
MNNNTKYSIQDITERKNNKKSELSASKKKIQELTQNLFSPPEAKNKMDLMMHHFNTGMAAYDGIMTGVKIYKRLRAVFSRKKYNKA